MANFQGSKFCFLHRVYKQHVKCAFLTLAPIWLPHWPACRCTISLMFLLLCWRRSGQTTEHPAIGSQRQRPETSSESDVWEQFDHSPFLLRWQEAKPDTNSPLLLTTRLPMPRTATQYVTKSLTDGCVTKYTPKSIKNKRHNAQTFQKWLEQDDEVRSRFLDF